MDAKAVVDDYSMPLLVGEKQQHGLLGRREEEIESNNHNHDYQKTKSSFVKTCFNGLNALSGAGLLSIPYALASGGWLSLILLFVISSAAFYSGILIKRSLELDSINITTYSDIGYRAFGNKGRTMAAILMYTEQYLVATGFLILGGDNLNNLFPGVKLDISGGLALDGQQCFILIVALAILPSVWFDNLSLLSYVSASGVIASLVIFLSIVWAGAFDGIGFHLEKTSLLNLKGLPTAVSLYAFCYSAHPVFPGLYTNIKNKNQFSNVLALCFFLCTFTYAAMAVLGYLMYGSDIQSEITLNLPTKNLSSKVATYTTLITPIAKYAINVTPIVDEVKRCLPNYLSPKFSGMIIGTTILISNVVVALTVPFFASLMSLVGAFVSVTTAITFPCLCYFKISGNYQRFGYETVVLISIMMMGIAVAICGTYTSLIDILGKLQS
ncbi:amino acid transporter AVT1J-like [Humulus lupulus]|uniref:amino acid transporter AVT1J-like n=1 Tax=Humulus lupulus TaxID=3486 RepID=UPI002B40772D|nr:amino acid transporter AVT1J-like [Humulus lupulus]XP_062085309.1 amino acid transporter AVT1J-like [Humulus lupulus]XP_062085310.1 amino acid transporter AVT1J-like [Humulus lupulus]